MNHRFAGFILAMAASPLCMATDADPREQETVLFKALDSNGDGYISQLEAHGDTDLVPKFSSLDKNHDKKLSREEFVPFSEPAQLEIPLPGESRGIKPAIQIKPAAPPTGGVPGFGP